MRLKSTDPKRILRKAGVILFWLLVWQLLALWVDNEILMVTPVGAVRRLGELCCSTEFWKTLLFSMGRISAGFLLGAVTGFGLAVLAGRLSFLEEILNPFMTMCKTVPVASFVVLLLIWWGSAYLAVSICFLIVLPNIYISTLEGIRSTDKKLLEMAKVFRLSFWNRAMYIYRPALKPFLNSSLKLALGMCWKSGVAAEVIGTPANSIGEQLYFSKIHLDTAGVFAWTAVIILLSICFEKIFLWLVEKFFAWEPACKPQRVQTDSRGNSIGSKRTNDKIERCRTESSRTESRGKNDRTDTLQDKPAPAITINNLSKKYNNQIIYEDFSETYLPGETYCLTSPSGSGKTTLMRMICGLEAPDAGSIEAEGLAGVMFQEDRLCEDYSAVKNVEMVVGDSGIARRALLQLLEEEALEKPCAQLSGGMKRRVALVRAMEAEGAYVLLDEPFTGMDAETRTKAESYIKEKQQGRTLIMASHI